MKTLLRKMVLLTLPMVLFLVMVNYFGDAGNLFHNSEEQVAAFMLQGRIVTGMPNINERSLHKRLIRGDPIRRSMVVLGSSRLMLISSENFPSETFMNHSVAGATLEDLIALYQMYKGHDRLPKTILIGLDPWILNENNGQVRWESLSAEYRSFLSPGSTPRETGRWRIYAQLLSPAYFKSSLKMAALRLRKGQSQGVKPAAQRINDEFTRMPDGSISYDKKFREASAKEVQKRAEGYIRGSLYSLEGYERLSDRHIRIMHKFISDILANGVQVKFIMTPYHPIVYRHIQGSKKYRMVVEFEEFCRKLSTDYAIPVYGSLSPREAGLDDTCFYDGMHINEKGLRLILRQ